MVVAQLVRALDCGSRGRRFEPGLPPDKAFKVFFEGFFLLSPEETSCFGRDKKKKDSGASLKALSAGFPHSGSAQLTRLNSSDFLIEYRFENILFRTG